MTFSKNGRSERERLSAVALKIMATNLSYLC